MIGDPPRHGIAWWQWLYSVRDALNDGVHTGDVKATMRATAPSGWLICDGAEVSRTTYADLFAAIGTVCGVGDGSTTFNLPDGRKRCLVGVGADVALGSTGGAWNHTHSAPAHYHAMGAGADLNITASGDHSHSTTIDRAVINDTFGATRLGQSTAASTTATFATDSKTHTHAAAAFAGRIGLVTNGVNGNAAMTSGTNNAPYFVGNWLIKT